MSTDRASGRPKPGAWRFDREQASGDWVPADWQRIETIDAHTEGEPLRVILNGLPTIPGSTMAARRAWAQQNLDSLRRSLMLEPRGHADMYGCIVTPPASADGDFGVLFLHNEGWSTMCGHGIIAVVTVGVEAGLLATGSHPARFEIDTPAGRVSARAERESASLERGSGRVRSVAFDNVPSYAAALDAEVTVPGYGRVSYDLGFGGAFYAYVDAPSLGLDLNPENAGALITAGRAIKQAVMAAHPITHPTEPELAFLYGTIFVGPAVDPTSHSRNVCIFADGEVDRSPTGTGVSGRLAIHHARGEIDVDQAIEIESILGTRFTGRVRSTTRFGQHDAILPEVTGQAFVTGRSELLLAPDDPLREGFFLR